MKCSIFQTAAVAALAAGALLTIPTAAQAYTPEVEGALVSSSTVGPGGTVTFDVLDGTFEADEDVRITVTGQATANAFASVRAAVPTTTIETSVPSTVEGGIHEVDIRFSADATGAQVITATSPSNPYGVQASVVIAAPGSEAEADVTSADLPPTGIDSNQLLGVWVGGGLLVLAGGVIALGATVRRSRNA
jgi:hypothetical protein